MTGVRGTAEARTGEEFPVSMKDKAAIVGVGQTKRYRRGESQPLTLMDLAMQATLDACQDAGINPKEIDGFSFYSGAPADPGHMAYLLGTPEVRYAGTLTAGGSGAAGSVGLAGGLIAAGIANVVLSLFTMQQVRRFGGSSHAARQIPTAGGGGAYGGGGAVDPEAAFNAPWACISPGHNFSMLTRRHMAKYGTKREHFAEVCISQRNNALNRPQSMRKTPLTLEDYFAARMISDPLCLFDYTMEGDGAIAFITVSTERAWDLKHPPVLISGTGIGGAGNTAHLLNSFQMPDDVFATAGAREVGQQAYAMAGVGPQDIDVALLYDHFSPMVLMQLEDFGFCPVGESGPFVADGNIRYGTGSLPVNTHGGNLSDFYCPGTTHIMEAVDQLRGTAINQVEGAELALCSGGPSSVPMTATILKKASR